MADADRRRILKLAAGGALSAAAWPLRSWGAAYDRIPTAMYVWGQSASASTMTSLCNYAKKYKIGTLNIQIDSAFRQALLSGNSSAVKAINVLKNSGLRAYALCGEHTWGQRVDLSPTIGQLRDIHVRYGVFSGLHFDVEPHVLDEWDEESNRPGLMYDLARFFERARAALPDTLATQAVLHPKFCVIEMSQGGLFLPYIAPHIGEVALMAYRNNPADQMSWAANGYPAVEAAGIPWRMAVLCSKPKSSISYYGTGASAFKSKMVDLWNRMQPAQFPLRRGLAYENYNTDSLRSILKP